MTTSAEPVSRETPRQLEEPPRKTQVRWLIAGLLFLGAANNYIDRSVLGVAAASIKKDFHLDTAAYGYIVVSFSWAYTVFYAFAGRAVDGLGTRIGYACALVWWSLACFAHGLARSAASFVGVRVALAAGESACWPASAKAVAEWFPKKERPLASGLFDSGSKVGMVIAPVFTAYLIAAYGWRQAFVFNGVLGFALLPLWLWFYRRPEQHPWVNRAEKEYIDQEETDFPRPETRPKIPWSRFLRYRQTYGFMLMYGSTSLAWMVLQNYLPLYFMEARHIDVKASGLASSAALTGAVLGNIVGGFLVGFLIARCKSLTAARNWAVGITSLLIAAMLPAALAPQLWQSVLLLAVCGFGFSAASTNAISMPGDFVPKEMVGSFWGIVATGAMLWVLPFKTFIGWMAEHWGWTAALAVPALIPFVGLLGMLLLVRRVEYLPDLESLAKPE